MGEEEKKMKRVMVTFDVDGTLIKSSGNSSNRLHRQAFSHAFFQVFGLKDISIDAIQHHGQTDPLILVNTLVHYGIPSIQTLVKAWKFFPAFLLCWMLYLQKVTGNLKEIAWMKMEGLDIHRYFTVPNFGGFGTDSAGVFNAEELQRASNGTAVILPDLSDAEAFIKLLGI